MVARFTQDPGTLLVVRTCVSAQLIWYTGMVCCPVFLFKGRSTDVPCLASKVIIKCNSSKGVCRLRIDKQFASR